MRIGIIASMQFAEQMLGMKQALDQMGHDAYVTPLTPDFVGLSDEEKETLKLSNKRNRDAISLFLEMMEDGDAVLALNYDKDGVRHYIGANTFLEIGNAYRLGQGIFLLNPIPNQPYIRTELEAMRPVVINGDLELIVSDGE